MRAFEILVQGKKLTKGDWSKLVKKIFEYEVRFTIEIIFKANEIEFYLFSQKDLSLISTKIEGFVLKPEKEKLTPAQIEKAAKKIRFRIPPFKNILEVKEQEEIKKRRTIKSLQISFQKVFALTFYHFKVIFQDQKGTAFFSTFHSLNNPLLNFEFDFENNPKIKKKSIPLFLKIGEVTKLSHQVEGQEFLEIFGFPHFSLPMYFPLKSFEFGRHGLVVGQTGVGKSKFIELLVKNLAKSEFKNDYRVVVIDPHAVLYPQFLNLTENKINFDFIHFCCNLFPSFSEPKIATELTILLFKTLLKDQFNAKMERVLKYVVYVLFLKNQMSLTNLRKMLTELEFRKEVLTSGLGSEFDYLLHFFETEFVELQTKFYEVAIMPILVLIDELNFIPAFSANLPSQNLESSLKDNFLTSFSLNRIFLGEKATRLIAGLIIQQIFLISQKRTLGKKIILIIDEVSIVENESLINILAEARKFDLSLILSQQYLTQITSELLKGILSNVFNYFVFKVSDEDAKILGKNLDINFPDDILKNQKEKGLSEEDLKRNLLVTLNPRECLVRVFAEGKFCPCFKAKTAEI